MSDQVSLEELERARAIVRRANAEVSAADKPLPGAAGEAFTEGPIQIGPYTVRKLVAGDWRTLQRIQNGLMLLNAEMEKPEAERREVWDDQTDAELIWLLIHSRDEIRAALMPGVDAFKRKCMAETLDEMPGHIVGKLCDAVQEQIRRSSATIIKFGQPEKEGADAPVFFQETKDSLPTASAGGSPTSAAS